MKKYLFLLLTLMILIVLLSACSNPQGGFGPSWDLSIRVPIVSYSEDNQLTVEDIFGDDVNFEDGFNDSLLDGENTYNIGSELTNYTFPNVAEGESIALPTIEVADLINPYSQDIPLMPGINSESVAIPSIDIPDIYDRVTFAALDKDNLLQEARITVTNNTSNITIESLTINIDYSDGDNNPITDIIDFTNIQAGQFINDTFLNGLTINSEDMNMSATITTSGTSDADISQDTMTISVSFPDVIESVQGLDTSGLDIDYHIEETITLPDLVIEEGVKEITFASGDLGIDLTDIPGLNLEWDSLSLAGLTNSDSIIPLTGETVDLNDGSLTELSFKIHLTDNDSFLDYNAGDTVGISGGFSNVSIDSVLVDVSQLNLSNFDKNIVVDPIDIDIDSQLRDELAKIEITPTIIARFAGLQGMTMDLSNVTFRALDSTLDPATGVIDQFNLDSGHNGLNFEVDLMAYDPDLLDFIKNPATHRITIGGSYDVAGDNVVVGSDSKVGLESIDVQLPYQLTLADDFTYSMDPELVEVIDGDSYDKIKDDIRGTLVIKEFNNDFPFPGTVKVYAVDIDTMANPNPTLEEIKTYLYSGEDDNLIKEVSVKQRVSYEEFLVELDIEDFEIFKDDNVYAGVKIMVPANNEGESYEFYDGDEISFKNIYLTLTGSVNK